MNEEEEKEPISLLVEGHDMRTPFQIKGELADLHTILDGYEKYTSLKEQELVLLKELVETQDRIIKRLKEKYLNATEEGKL